MPVAFLWEKGAEIPAKAYIEGHPRSPECVDTCGGYEYVNVWLNK